MILLLNMMNQALAYIMLVAVGVLVVGPLTFYAASNITSNAMSYQDFAELQNKRVAQNIVVSHIQHEDDRTTNTPPEKGEIHIHMVNSGLEEIGIEHILIDGIKLEREDDGATCWPADRPNIKPEDYCFYSRHISEPTTKQPCPDPPATLPNIAIKRYPHPDPNSKCPDFRENDQLKIGIIYDLTDPKFSSSNYNSTNCPKLIQLVTESFKLFEVSIPTPKIPNNVTYAYC